MATSSIETFIYTMGKIYPLIILLIFFVAHMLLSDKLSDMQISFHEMKGYKDALLVQFLHNPEIVVLNLKNEPENFMLDADKLNRILTNSPYKEIPNYQTGNTSYHIHIYDTQTGKYWDFKNYFPVDANYEIDIDEKNIVWRYANILYPNKEISTVLIRAVYVVGKKEDRYKKKQGMKCNTDKDCANELYCTDGRGAGQFYKTCQPIWCKYNKKNNDKAKSACECISEKLKDCGTKKCCDGDDFLDPTPPETFSLIKGQPCISDDICRSNDCNDNYEKPSEYYTCN